MALAVDDELVPDVDEPVAEPNRSASKRGRNDPAAVPDPAVDHTQTELGVVVVPGRDGQSDKVGGYFFTISDDGHIINSTSIPTERILEAARETGLPVYVRNNGLVLQARLDASGHSLTPISPIVPNGDLLRSMALPENDQHAYLDRHLENIEAAHHSPDWSVAQQSRSKSVSRPVLSPQALVLPSLPSVPQVSPTSVSQASPSTPSGSSSVSVPVGSGQPAAQPGVTAVESHGDTGQPTAPISVPTIVPGATEQAEEAVDMPSEDESTMPVAPSGGSPESPSSPGSPPASSIDVPGAPRAPQSQTSDAGTTERASFEPMVMPSTDSNLPTTESDVKRDQSTEPKAPTPTAQPQYGRRPRRTKPPTATTTPQQISGVDTLSPSSPVTPPTDEARRDASAPVSPRARVADHQVASRPMVSAPASSAPVSSAPLPNVGESAINVEQASPAIASGGARRRASPLKPSLVARTATPPPAVTGEPSEELDRANAAPELLPITPAAEVPPEMVGGGVLEGVVDTPEAKAAQETAWRKELAQQQLELQRQGRRGLAANDLGYTRGLDRPQLANGDSYDALRAESDKAQNLLPVNEPVQSAFAAQVPQNLPARAARFGQLQAQRKAQRGAAVGAEAQAQQAAIEAGNFLKTAYKRMWHSAQEAAEDTALSFGDFMIISGPIVIALYVSRWVFGNMMGNLFTRQITLPGALPVNGKAPQVEVHMVPGYEVGDMLDYVRHMKFLLVGAITLMIYGFMAIVLYYTFRPTELVKLGLKGLEVLIGLLSP